MPSILSTNMASLYAQRSLASAQTELAGSVQKLSSGRQINSAKDNAAGLGISEGVASIRNISDQSIRNLQSATSLVQTADGALDVVGKMLQRILTLTTQKADAVLSAAQTTSIDTEITALTEEITRIKNRTTYNDTASVFGRTYTFGSGAGVTKDIVIPDMTPLSLGLQTQSQTIAATLVSDSGADTFNIAAHGYSTGDQIKYYSGTGSAIGNLPNGSYYVVKIDNDNFKLATSLANASASTPTTIDITSLGTVADDKFQKLYGINEVGPNNATTNILVLSQPLWGVNEYVIFNKGTSTSFSPLVDGSVYQIASNDGISITLKDLSGNPIAFAAGQSLLGSSLGYLDGSRTAIAAAADPDSNQITIAGHNFATGKQVFFKSNSVTIGGLSDGAYYVVSTGANTFKLASSLDNATAATPITIDLLSSSGSGNFEIKTAVSSAINFNINPILQSNTIQFNSASGLSGGDQVIYRKGTSDALIDPLVDGATYYLVGSGNTYRLSTNSAGTDLVTINSATGYSNSSFEKVTSATFDSTSGSVVKVDSSLLRSASSNGYLLGDSITYSVTGGDPINGLTPGNYFAIPINGTDFRLASSASNALNGISVSLGANGSGTDNFTKNSTITSLSVMTAIATNASNRAGLGAQLNALDYAIDNLQTLSNNLSEAYSRIMDTDYAAETSALTRNQILQQAATSMLAQANQMPNVILTLLR
jgi:flagellin-like hook-associated protein FlgL